MAWYRTGTVTLTSGSATVAGAGTDFISNARVGDAFIGPNGTQYEVTNIASATALSISPAWPGASVSGAAYSIMPVNGYVKKLVDAAGQIITDWGETLAGLGDVSTKDVVPIAMGGTNATTAAAARTNLGLGSAAVAAIVGTVSQTAGVPTGALMESGSNANGEYFKYACGMLVCIKRNFNVPGFVIAPGAMGGSSLYPFPAPFVDVPARSFSGYVSDGAGARTGIPLIDDSAMNGGSADGWRFYIKNTTAANTQVIYACHLIAVGRWF